MSAVYTETFYIVPRRIREIPGITFAFMDVYEAIFQFSNKKLPCFLNNKSLAERAGVEIRQVQYALQFLEKAREIKRINKGLKRYLICVDRPIEIECTENIQECTPVHPEAMHSSAPPPCTPVHPEYKEREYKEKDYISPISSKSGPKKDLSKYKDDKRFMRFYEAYPKKQDPRDAYKAFISIVGDDEDLLERIIHDVEERKAKHSQWKDKQYIKYPAVYLRKAEYEGEIINARADAEAKKKEQAAEARKKDEERTQASQKAFERELAEQRRLERDQLAGIKLKKQIAEKPGMIQGLKNLRNTVGLK